MSSEPITIEEWYAQASLQEQFKFWQERLDEAKAKIKTLQAKLDTTNNNLATVLMFLKTHRHDQQGLTVFDPNMIQLTPDDQNP